MNPCITKLMLADNTNYSELHAEITCQKLCNNPLVPVFWPITLSNIPNLGKCWLYEKSCFIIITYNFSGCNSCLTFGGCSSITSGGLNLSLGYYLCGIFLPWKMFECSSHVHLGFLWVHRFSPTTQKHAMLIGVLTPQKHVSIHWPGLSGYLKWMSK